MKSEEGLGIEYDENVICDVCRSPDSEDGNEMVFCDSCNICVHQACYGITVIPDGMYGNGESNSTPREVLNEIRGTPARNTMFSL